MLLDRTSAWRRAVRLGLVLLAGLAAPAGAEEEPAAQAFGEVIEVEVVNVEVWVTDRAGKPVEGLSGADFRVFHDGEPVALSHFAELSEGRVVSPVGATPDGAAGSTAGGAGPLEQPSGSTEAAAALPSPTPSPTHLVVVFDQVHLEAASVKRLARDLKAFLAGGSIAPDRVLVLRLDRDLFIEVPFGSSAAELEQALDRLGGSATLSLGAHADAGRMLGEMQGLWNQLQNQNSYQNLRSLVEQAGGAGGGPNTAPAPGGLASVPTPQTCDDFTTRVQPLIAAWAQAERAEIATTLARLSDVAAFLSALDGVKVLLYLSDGLPTAPGLAASSFVRGVCPGVDSGLELHTLAEEMSRAFFDLTRHANANRVTVYALQGTGLQPSLLGSAREASSDVRGMRSFETSLKTTARVGLATLAEETGGRAVLNRSKFGDELERIGAEIGSYYSLAFAPPAGRAGPRHRIEVRPVDASLSVRHRREYLDKTSEQWLAERLEGALYLGLSDNPLGARLGAGELKPGAAGAYHLPLHVLVPVARLTFVEEGGPALARVRLKVMTLHTASRKIARIDRTLRLPRPGPGAGELMDLAVDLELAAGTHLVAVGLADDRSREASFVSTTLEVLSPPAPGS